MDSIIFLITGSGIILAAFISGILLIPFHLSIDINKDINQLAGKYRLAWLGITLKSGDIFVSEDLKILEKAREKESIKDELWIEPRQYPKINVPNIETLIDALPAIFRLLKELMTSLQIELLNCRIFFGFQDPVETAATYGYIWSLISAIGLRKENIVIEPYFEKERFDGSILAEIRAQLIWMVIAIFHAIRNEKLRMLLKDMARRNDLWKNHFH
jgi:Protein of unknown function (DUF2953)